MLNNSFGTYKFKGLILYYDDIIDIEPFEEYKFINSDIIKLKKFYNKFNK